MPTYAIEENAVYYLNAKSKREAEKIFLNAIVLKNKKIHCEVKEREVYLDPEQRLVLED